MMDQTQLNLESWFERTTEKCGRCSVPVGEKFKELLTHVDEPYHPFLYPIRIWSKDETKMWTFCPNCFQFLIRNGYLKMEAKS